MAQYQRLLEGKLFEDYFVTIVKREGGSRTGTYSIEIPHDAAMVLHLNKNSVLEVGIKLLGDKEDFEYD